MTADRSLISNLPCRAVVHRGAQLEHPNPLYWHGYDSIGYCLLLSIWQVSVASAVTDWDWRLSRLPLVSLAAGGLFLAGPAKLYSGYRVLLLFPV